MQPSSFPASLADAAIVSAGSARADHMHTMAEVVDARPWYPTGIVTGLPVVGSTSLTLDATLLAGFSYTATGTRVSKSAVPVDVEAADWPGWIRKVAGGIALAAGVYKIAARMTVALPDEPPRISGNLTAGSTFVLSLVLAESEVDSPRLAGAATIKYQGGSSSIIAAGDIYGVDGSINASSTNQNFYVAGISGSGDEAELSLSIGGTDALAGPMLLVPRIAMFGTIGFTAGNSTNRYTIIGLNGTTISCEIDIDKLV